MNEDIYRAAMDAIKDSGSEAHRDALALADVLKAKGVDEYHRIWLGIAAAISEIQGQKIQ